jgi:uncharacterized protein YciI
MWFICLRRALVPREEWTTTVDEHLAWMKNQHESGAIVFSGPGRAPDGGMLGIYLIRAPSHEEAEQIAAGDPFTANGHCTFDLIDWEVHQIMGAGAFTAAGLRR